MQQVNKVLHWIGIASLVVVLVGVPLIAIGGPAFLSAASAREEQQANSYAATTNAESLQQSMTEIARLNHLLAQPEPRATVPANVEIARLQNLLHQAEAQSDGIRYEGYLSGYFESCIRLANLGPETCEKLQQERKSELGVGP